MEELPEDLNTLKVVELKELLRQRSLPVSGTKPQLIARLQEIHPEQVEHELQRQDDHNKRTLEEVRESIEDDTAKRVKMDHPAQHQQGQEEEGDTIDQLEPKVNVVPSSKNDVNENNSNGHDQRDGREEVSKGEQMEIVQQNQQLEGEMINDDDDETGVYNFDQEEMEQNSRPTDMYLDTINRHSLDFDFERLCSVTLSHNHIYACLVDGKYFQGRGKSSEAYAHSIGEDHHVFINLETQKVYVLPDGYEVSDPSLSDIKHLLNPTFTPQLLSSLDRQLTPHYDLSQRPFYPGFVGLNNIKHNSYLNSILISLLHVIPLRNYFILNPITTSTGTTELVRRFGLFCRKVWNDRPFKSQVSPHELLQEIATRSGGKFKITEEGDPAEFLGWLLNTLHRDLGGNRKVKSSIIHACFQGELRIDDQQILRSGEYGTKPKFDVDREIKTNRSPFLFLTLDLPPPPLFQSHLANDIAPQVSLTTLLSKYNGTTTSEISSSSSTSTTSEGGGKSGGTLRRYKLERLPEFVVLNVKRFKSNRFGEEKNPTIVNFPLRGVDFSEYVEGGDNKMNNNDESMAQYYDLVSNITHTSLAGTARDETQWKTYVHLRPERDERGNLKPIPVVESSSSSTTADGEKGKSTTTGKGDVGKVKMREVKEEEEKWFEMQDLVVGEIEKEMIALGESYIQIWERRRPNGNHDDYLKVETPKSKPKGVAAAAVK